MPRSEPRSSPLERASGFTLVELLVAITLLGFLSLALAGSLRFGSRAWERVETDSRSLEDLQITRGFITDRLERSILPIDETREQSEEGAFQGTATALRFISTMPGHLNAQGFYRVTVGLDQSNSGTNLLLSWRPHGDDSVPNGSGRRVLLTSLQSLRVSYFRREEGDEIGRWQDTWEDPEALPDLVRIAVAFAENDTRTWPPLVIAPRITGIE